MKLQDQELRQGKRAQQAETDAKIFALAVVAFLFTIIGLLIADICDAQTYTVVIDHNRNGVKHSV